MKHKLGNGGFTLAEALIAVGIASVFFSSAMGSWIYMAKNWQQENIRGEARYDVEKAMEQIKEEIRLADNNNILFYPSGSGPYSAISIPTANLTSGLFNIPANSTISWDNTVMYYVSTSGGQNSLKRVVSPYNATLATRQSQLDNLVASGTLPAGSTSTTLFTADAVSLAVESSNPTFDGYNASADLSGNTSFGIIRLTSGNHNIRFQVTGKNAGSSGYRVGVDQITLSPSGGPQEAEDLPISATSGATTVSENMAPYAANAIWNGNYQEEYRATTTGDYIQFQVYYDGWLESNFASMTHSNSQVIGTNPVLSVASRETQGLIAGWSGNAQTGASVADDPVSIHNSSVRNIVSGASIIKSGQMVRFKFTAATGGQLVINSAYFGVKDSGTPYNFLSAPTQLYFDNAPVQEGAADGVGAVGTGSATSVTIPPGYHVWSNWFVYSVTGPSASDYLVSFSVASGAINGYDSYWNPGAGTNSYTENGSSANGSWAVSDIGFAADPSIHALDEMGIWTSTGTATSQIYDTKMTTPVYSQLSWTTNGSGTYSIKVRTSSDSNMSGASAWGTLSPYGSSPASLAGLANNRYIQFQATLTAASPYTTYPQLDKVNILWPGQTADVEVSGFYTKRPNYGVFKVLVDGQTPTNALNVTLAVDKSFRGTTYNNTLHAQVRPRNTGK